MKAKLLISLMISFLHSMVSAQDWQCIQNEATTFFIDTTDYYYQPNMQNTVWAARIDSVRDSDGYRYFYGYHSLRQVSFIYGYWSYECLDPKGASRIGKCMSSGPDGNFFFNSKGDAIRICTDKHAGDSWICCRINDTTRLYAFINEETVDSILGNPDSVKYMTFEARHINGQVVSHPLNGKPFVLSKHFGMITLYDFFVFPAYSQELNPFHVLCGIDSDSSKQGIQNLTKKRIYSFSPGDLFHTFFKDWWSDNYTDSHETRILNTILDSTWNADGSEVIYRVARFTDDWFGLGTEHNYTRDTVNWVYNFSPGESQILDKLPGETCYVYSDSNELKSANTYVQYPGKTGSYHSRYFKTLNATYFPASYCSDTLVGISTSPESISGSSYFIEGCGGGYYSYGWNDGHWYYHKQYSLVYYKKGEETYGTPINTSTWLDPNALPEEEKSGSLISLYPNPASNKITIKINRIETNSVKLQIYDLLNRKVKEYDVDGTFTILNIEDLSKGLFLVKVFDGHRIIGIGKFVHE